MAFELNGVRKMMMRALQETLDSGLKPPFQVACLSVNGSVLVGSCSFEGENMIFKPTASFHEELGFVHPVHFMIVDVTGRVKGVQFTAEKLSIQ